MRDCISAHTIVHVPGLTAYQVAILHVACSQRAVLAQMGLRRGNAAAMRSDCICDS